MRILQLHGADFITLPLAVQLETLGHSVTTELFEVEDWSGFDVVHIHWLESLPNKRLTEYLSLAASSPNRPPFFLSVYPCPGGAAPSSPPDIKLFSHVFVSSPDCTAQRGANSQSWLSAGLSLSVIPYTAPLEPSRHAGPVIVMVEAADIAAQVPKEEFVFPGRHQLLWLESGRELDIAAVSQSLRACHLLVESVRLHSYGIIGLLAMAFGKAVLSGNTAEARDQWEQLQTSPVLHVDSLSLRKRIESLLLEPRCLRDLGKRGRQYVEKFHNVATTAQLVLQAYERALRSPRSS